MTTDPKQRRIDTRLQIERFNRELSREPGMKVLYRPSATGMHQTRKPLSPARNQHGQAVVDLYEPFVAGESETVPVAHCRPIPPDPKTPELERLNRCRTEMDAQREMIGWLAEQSRLICAIEDPPEAISEWMPVTESVEAMLYRFHEIDARKVEAERRALLEWQRELNRIRDDA